MTFSTGKTKIACITFAILMLASVILITAQIQPVNAADPPGVSSFQQSIDVPAGVTVNATTDTKAILSYTPNPIGVGQTLLINAWINPSVHSNRGVLSGKTGSFQITITKPDGTKEVLKMPSTFSDCTSYISYTPIAVGQYQIKFDFLGTYWPAGWYYNGWRYDNPVGSMTQDAFGGGSSAINSTYYRPSSTGPFNFTVQADFVPSYPPSPLPTDYWTRPVNFIHREWWPILGNWPPTGYQGTYFGSYWDQMYPGTNPTWGPNYLFAPFVQGPESSHIVWKREMGGSRSGGMIGAYGTFEGQYIDPGIPSVVYNGRCYQTIQKADPEGSGKSMPYLQCYDLRTGEIYWEIRASTVDITSAPFGTPQTTTTTLAPQYVAYISPSANSRYGEVLAGGTHNVELVGIYNDRFYKWHPYTGAITGNYSISPLSGGTFYNQIDGYVLTVQNLGNTVPAAQRYRLINWTTSGSTTNFTQRIMSNTSYARSSLGSYVDYGAGIGVAATNFNTIEYGGWWGLSLPVYNLWTGASIMNISSPHPDTSYSMLCTCVDHGKVAEVTQDGHVKAWDRATGRLAWDYAMQSPWSATGWGVYGVASAYGMFFRPAYDGLYAINWTDGKLVWFTPRYSEAAFESPYTEGEGGPEVNPGQTNVRIADGKVYIYDGEHSPAQPRSRSWALWCLDAFTGDVLWKIHMVGATSFGQDPSTGPIVDGYLMFPSTDGVIYTIGMGKSAMTMSGPTTAVPLGTKAVVQGSVMDMSPAQPNTPCVAKESMTLQMEYLHYQAPIAGIWGNETIKGVPVRLTAIDENGTSYDLGTTTSNGYTGAFSFGWAAPKEGKYEVIASFGPDESYGSSSASASIYVGPAPATTTNQGSQPDIVVPDYTMTIIGSAIAILIAVALVGVLVLRKR